MKEEGDANARRAQSESRSADADATADSPDQFARIYAELRALARHYLRGERANHTLQPTALVNEAYLRLQGTRKVSYADRRHFFATAARAMRQILVDHARAKRTLKRSAQTVSLSSTELGVEPRDVHLLDLDDAVRRLQEADPERAAIVELHFFGGLTVRETAESLGLAERTVFRKLRSSKAWLRSELGSPHAASEGA